MVMIIFRHKIPSFFTILFGDMNFNIIAENNLNVKFNKSW